MRKYKHLNEERFRKAKQVLNIPEISMKIATAVAGYSSATLSLIEKADSLPEYYKLLHATKEKTEKNRQNKTVGTAGGPITEYSTDKTEIQVLREISETLKTISETLLRK